MPRPSQASTLIGQSDVLTFRFLTPMQPAAGDLAVPLAAPALLRPPPDLAAALLGATELALHYEDAPPRTRTIQVVPLQRRPHAVWDDALLTRAPLGSTFQRLEVEGVERYCLVLAPGADLARLAPLLESPPWDRHQYLTPAQTRDLADWLREAIGLSFQTGRLPSRAVVHRLAQLRRRAEQGLSPRELTNHLLRLGALLRLCWASGFQPPLCLLEELARLTDQRDEQGLGAQLP